MPSYKYSPPQRVWQYGFLGASALSEMGAFITLARGHSLSALGLHVFASVSAGALVGTVVLEGNTTSRVACKSSILAMALFAFSLPGMGIAAVLSLICPALKRNQSCEAMPMRLDSWAADGLRLRTPRAYPERIVIRDLLANSSSVADRLAAVLTLRTMPDHRAVPILRSAFLDENEEVRLSAFADLSRRENQLRGRIRLRSKELEGVGGATSGRSTYLHRALAQDHWELVFGGFVPGALEERTLRAGARHAQVALDSDATGATAILLARIELRLNEPLLAWRTLEAAQAAGVAEAVCAPLFAEAAYASRQFEAVVSLLSKPPRTQLRRANLHSVVEFWTSQSDARARKRRASFEVLSA